MIRTLIIIAAVSFTLCVACLAGSFAIAGGPFFIDDHWRFHHTTWSDDDADDTGVDIRVGPSGAPTAAPPPAPAPNGPSHHKGAPV